jgi:hypothetical protein
LDFGNVLSVIFILLLILSKLVSTSTKDNNCMPCKLIISKNGRMCPQETNAPAVSKSKQGAELKNGK